MINEEADPCPCDFQLPSKSGFTMSIPQKCVNPLEKSVNRPANTRFARNEIRQRHFPISGVLRDDHAINETKNVPLPLLPFSHVFDQLFQPSLVTI